MRPAARQLGDNRQPAHNRCQSCRRWRGALVATIAVLIVVWIVQFA